MRTLPLSVAPLIAALLLAAAPAHAGQRATYARPDGEKLVIDVADNGDARVGEPGKEEYGLLLKDGFYMVSREDGTWRAARIADVAAAIDQVVPPIFKDIFAATGTPKAPPRFRIEPAEAQTVAGRPGKTYRVFGTNDSEPDTPVTFVMSDDPALAPVGRAMEQFMNGAMVPAAVFIGPAAADIVAETRAIFALGTPLEAVGQFKLESLATLDVPPSALALPVKPSTTAELVAAMKAAMPAPAKE